MMRLAKPNRGVLRDSTSFELVACDEHVVAREQRNRLRAEVDDTDEAIAASEREDLIGGRQPFDFLAETPRRLMAKTQAGAVEREHRARVVELRLDRQP